MGSQSRRPFVSVKFSPIGRAQRFLLPGDDAAEDTGTASPHLPPLAPGDQVVVETPHGAALARIISTVPLLANRLEPPPDSANCVVRLATREDEATRAKHTERERDAFRVCSMKIREHGLAMKLTRVEQLFDGSKLIFYYTADARVDFRELVRELAAHYRTRIEMRQIGVRDEARMLGGYGACGQPLCCAAWLTSFEPVTIKMAKLQNLSLNPSRLSGMCGRLKCCLRYEIADGGGATTHNGAGDETDGCEHCGSCEGCCCSRQ
jgi:cell fate regulator YaaT (PSP1 superfamily)